MVHNYRFLDFFRFFVRVTLYYFGCMFVASSLNHFWFWFLKKKKKNHHQ